MGGRSSEGWEGGVVKGGRDREREEEGRREVVEVSKYISGRDRCMVYSWLQEPLPKKELEQQLLP